jgi:hypothetical protein
MLLKYSKNDVELLLIGCLIGCAGMFSNGAE